VKRRNKESWCSKESLLSFLHLLPFLSIVLPCIVFPFPAKGKKPGKGGNLKAGMTCAFLEDWSLGKSGELPDIPKAIGILPGRAGIP
jgi:hypothetical protein